MKRILEHAGIVFLVVLINQQVFLLDGQDFLDYIYQNERKSIPYSYFLEKGHIIKEKIDPPLDYLALVDQLYFGGTI